MNNEKDKQLAHEVLMSGQSRYIDPTLEEKIEQLARVRARFNEKLAPSPSSPVPEEQFQPRICIKCGHSDFNRVQGECDEPGDDDKLFCGCKCEFPAATPTPVEQSIDPIGDFVDKVWALTNDRDGWSRITLRGLAETLARQYAAPSPSLAAREAEERIPKTTYKNKRQLSDKERFRLNSALNDYTFNNCDHKHDGYPNHLACRWCVLEIIAAITCSPVPAAGGDEDGPRSGCCNAPVTLAHDGPICGKCGKWTTTKTTTVGEEGK